MSVRAGCTEGGNAAGMYSRLSTDTYLFSYCVGEECLILASVVRPACVPHLWSDTWLLFKGSGACLAVARHDARSNV